MIVTSCTCRCIWTLSQTSYSKVFDYFSLFNFAFPFFNLGKCALKSLGLKFLGHSSSLVRPIGQVWFWIKNQLTGIDPVTLTKAQDHPLVIYKNVIRYMVHGVIIHGLRLCFNGQFPCQSSMGGYNVCGFESLLLVAMVTV